MRRILVASGLSLIGAGAWVVSSPVSDEQARLMLLGAGGALIMLALMVQLLKDRKKE